MKTKQLSGKYAEIKKNEPLIRVARFLEVKEMQENKNFFLTNKINIV